MDFNFNGHATTNNDTRDDRICQVFDLQFSEYHHWLLEEKSDTLLKQFDYFRGLPPIWEKYLYS